jgi:hypothetical protein
MSNPQAPIPLNKKPPQIRCNKTSCPLNLITLLAFTALTCGFLLSLKTYTETQNIYSPNSPTLGEIVIKKLTGKP